MFKQRTVVVIGAGAGVEYNMPLGSQLVTDIAEDVRFRFDRFRDAEPVSGSPELFRALYNRFKEDRDQLNKFTVAGNDLAAVLSSSVSIDDALYQLSETSEAVTLGKMSIVRAILSAEASSTIQNQKNGRPDENDGRNGWIEQIFSMAISGFKRSEIDFAFNNITFVNFNYDRCVEHYLYWALQRIGIEKTRSAAIVRDLEIIRPYGGIGSILAGDHDQVPFGGNTDLFDALKRIRTYTESEALHDGSALEQAILNARLIMFLGFGFHAQNMELLKVSQQSYRRVMATVKKVHPENKSAIAAEIAAKLACVDQGKVELFDMTAPEMLRELRPKIQLTVG